MKPPQPPEMQDTPPAELPPDLPPPSVADLVRAYHRRTKHRFERYAAGPETLDWDDQPAAFRHFEGVRSIPLPLAEPTQQGALGEALRRPFAAPVTQHVPFDLASLGACLHLALGITAWKRYGPDRWAVRANPSSGNLHPVEAYLIACDVPGLANGLYHYEPEQHALECRARHLSTGSLPPGLHIALSSVMWREAWKYGERAFRYCQLDTGHAMAALRYACAAMGWSLTAQPQLDNHLLASVLGLDRLADFPARRAQATELEEAEVLLSLGLDNSPAPVPTARALRAASSSAVWMGTASSIDRHPMYHWPVIAEVAALTREALCTTARQSSLALPPGQGGEHEDAASGKGPGFAEVVLGRRSAQHFDPAFRMPRTAFMHLMSRLMAQPAAPWDVLPAVWEMHLLLFVHRVEDLPCGAYLLTRGKAGNALQQRLNQHYTLSPVAGLPPGLDLQLIAAMEAPALQRLARSLHCHQDIAAHASFALGMLCEFDPALEASPASYRELFRQAGLLGQVLYLEAEAMGLRGTGIGCYFDDAVHEMLGLEDTHYQSLYHFTVGKPRLDERIETLAAYADRETAVSTAPNVTAEPIMSTTEEASPEMSPRFQRISAQRAAELIQRHRQASPPTLALFDTRDRMSFDAGHIAGAQFLSDASFGQIMAGLPRSTPIMLYCFRGNASQTWAGMFADFRYTEVYSVDGGHDALAAALAQPAAPVPAGPPGELSASLRNFLSARGFTPEKLNEAREHGLTPLMHAAWRGEVALLRELIALGADVQCRNADGNTAVWLACVAASEEAVRALAEAGAQLDSRNDTGATALMYCASSAKPAMLALLLELGADPMVTNFDDARAVDLCASLECLNLLRHTADLPT
ncbi:SagB family peptide dehydrogenase [Uliginosibacterium aquaticum]|nr:SagB family peptide dehydrogenase [Uliginosibacterium aquaticum]